MRRARTGLALAAGFASAAVALAQVAQPAPKETPPSRDRRSIVLIREDCVSTIGRQELTLFANGTIRLRHGPPEAIQMALHELNPEALKGFETRLSALDLSEAERSTLGPSGEWTERCVLELGNAGLRPDLFEYDRYSTGSLALERARRIVEDLLDEVRQSIASSDIPSTYKPAIGDRLERVDGEVFEVVAFTLEGKGVELVGLVQPITLYVEREKLRELFRRIVSDR